MEPTEPFTHFPTTTQRPFGYPRYCGTPFIIGIRDYRSDKTGRFRANVKAVFFTNGPLSKEEAAFRSVGLTEFLVDKRRKNCRRRSALKLC